MKRKVTKKKTTGKSPQLPAVVRGIRDVSELRGNHAVLLYGKSGRGKTHVASTFPRPILFLDINHEQGLKTVKGVQGIEVAKVTSWEEYEDLYWWLRDQQKYKTIVSDQITGLQDLCMRHVREKLNMKEDAPFFRKHWGHLSGDMKTWLYNYRSLVDTYNIVFIAHERAFGGDDETEDDEIDPSIGARVMPSVGSFVDGACDIIGHCFIRSFKERVKGKLQKRTEYCMRVGPHPVYATKIRRPASLGPLPEYIVDPTYQKLIDLEAGKEVKTRKTNRRVKNGKK